MARADMQLRRWQDASDALGAAMAINTRIIERDPNNREERRDIASLHGLMSSLYQARGDEANAAKFAAMAREEQARLR
jgi:hypothetical protein